MMKPALATVGLFLALGYWNEWYLSSLYLGSTVEFKPLQYHLYNVINTANALRNSVAGSNVSITDLPSNTLKMASAVVATCPILLRLPLRPEILRQRHHGRRGQGLTALLTMRGRSPMAGRATKTPR